MFEFEEYLKILEQDNFDEYPVGVEEFVYGKQYLGLNKLSDYQMEIVKAGSQILKEEDLIKIFGEEAGRDRFRETFKEVILMLGKGCHTKDAEVFNARNGTWSTAESLMSSPNNTVSTVSGSAIVDGYATECFSEGPAAVYDVTTSRGHKIRVSEDHRFMTRDGLKKLKDVGVGEYIATAAKLSITEPSPIDEREVKLLAYWLGDGMMPLDEPGRRTINVDFSDGDIDALDEYVSILRSYGDEPTVTKHPTKKMWFVRSGVRGCPVTTELARKHGLWGARAHTKKIPDAVWSLPDSQIAIFLGRLWGTDGTVYLKRAGRKEAVAIEYTSVSRDLALGVQRLAARLGISLSIRSKTPQYAYNGEKRFGRVAYTVSAVDYETVYRFWKAVKLLDKSRTLDKLMTAKKPYRIWKRYDGDIFWDKIISVEGVGSEEVFSLTATDYENYVANLIVNGNSGK